MTDQELKNQLEGLFSDLEELTIEPPAPVAAEKKRTQRQPQLKAQLLEEDQLTLYLGTSNGGGRGADTRLPQPADTAGPFFSVGSPSRRQIVNWRVVSWTVVGILAALMFVAYGQAIFLRTSEAGEANQPRFSIPLSPTPAATPSATPTISAETFTFLEATVTPTPVPGGWVLVLTPAAEDVGWVVSGDESDPASHARPNHLGDSFLYAGVSEGKIHHAVIQFDLASIPRGAQIHAASLRLTGLWADKLNEARGGWRLQLLASEIDYGWRSHNYQQLHVAAPWATFEPPLTAAQLGVEVINFFEFTPEQLTLLERRLLEGSDQFGKKVSFRLDGPMAGDDNLFAWDSGYGKASKKAGPELFLSLGPAPAETPPPYYVIITSTPTPENVVTAAANSLRQTAAAEQVGTPTPLPPYWVTPVIVTITPTPENEATAQIMSQQGTAIAQTTGVPPNLEVVTATPTPPYVVITSTPTPADIMTAVADALRITAEAARVGTATPFPPNWVTPVVVTSTPTPANSATVVYRQAVILTTGTPTSMPGNAQTATPTPVAIAAQPLASPTATATPSPTPQPIPATLLGKIVFLSDREGATAEERQQADQAKATPQVVPQPYVFDPATGLLERLTAMWPYEVAAGRERWSADTTYEAYTKELLWTNTEDDQGNRTQTEVLAIHYYDYFYKVEHIVTQMGAGIVYDPAWSPVNDEIAFVATESGNDEVWLIKRDGTEARQLTRNQWEWDKHPSWSPDGQQIVFFSNRTGNNQLWLMNRDGSEQRLLMDGNSYNDWNPVWIKSLEPAPPLTRQPDWRFVKPVEESH